MADDAIAQAKRSGFYLSEDLRYRWDSDSTVFHGTVECEGGIRVQINERLRKVAATAWYHRKNDPLVRLEYYANNIVLVNVGTVVRYNSPHADHNTFHHLHRYDVFGDELAPGEQIMPVTKLHEREVPTLRQVMQEAEDWYHKNLGRLPKG